MYEDSQQRDSSRKQRGSILLIVSIGMVLLMAIAGLAIDLASLYVARGEAQRAADAGALAGAHFFVSSTYTSGGIDTATAEAGARQRAIDVAAQNRIAGETVVVTPADVTFPPSTPGNPLITVAVHRTVARGNPMPTFFARIFGISASNVVTSATAEAYNPSGGGPSVGTKCLKPWLMPNCDPGHLVSYTDARKNPNCAVDPANPTTSQYGSYFVDPTGGNIVNPGVSPGGVIGELITIKPGTPSEAATPGKFYPVFLPPGSVAAECPSCATGAGGGGPASGSLYRFNIACCNSNTITCGSQTIQPITGNMVGPTSQGTDCLIHQSGASGQDTLMTSPTLHILAGGNNPLVTAGVIPSGTTISTSDSVVTVPVYNGSALCPGNSCPESVVVTVVGFLQMFVKGTTSPQGTVQAYVMNVAGCSGSSGGGGGGTPPIISTGGSPVPVRLIYPNP